MIKKYKLKERMFLLLIIFLAFFLRFYKLSSDPPSLYWEEAALGYDAYSLLKTGKDHRGNRWPITYLKSYMDYKPPLYVYLVIPSIKLFGLNEFGVRFPSALAGTLTVAVIYFLTKEIFKPLKKTSGVSVEELAAFLLAISPWHLQFSRAAFEANLALFLTISGILLFLKSIRYPRLKFLLPISAILFGLSLYTYHGARVFTPLIVISLALLFYKYLWRIKLIALFSLLIGLSLSFPLLHSLKMKELNQRFQETSAFTSLNPILESNKRIQEDGGGRISKIINHRFWEYVRIFMDNYFKHFNGSYLFLSGDINSRHSTQEFGILYHWEIITLVLGVVYLLTNRNRSNLFVLSWLLLTPVSGSLTKSSPHALRTIFGLPSFIIISSLGLIQLISFLKNKRILVFSFSFLILAEFFLYLHFYYYHYPKLYSSSWQYGYKQAIKYLQIHQKEYQNIYLTNNYGRAYMYYLFYSKINPVQAQKLIKPFKEQANIPNLGNIFFTSSFPKKGKTLMITEKIPPKGIKLLTTIKFLNNKTAFYIWETK